jgi:methionyl-tRNA formyltransferase
MNTNPKSLRIVFMGTPVLASYCLSTLVDNGYNIVGVITAPDKPAGRGQSIRQSEVKTFAQNNHIPVLQPTNLKDPAFIQELISLMPDLQLVVAFRMLPEAVWSIPPLGTINMHASLLPNYRGAAPINWAIINQETETGVSTFFIDHKIDSGEVIFQKEIKIAPKETAGSLHDKIMIEGALIILKTINALADGNVSALKQSEMIRNPNQLKLAPKIFKEDCKIDWQLNCRQVEAHIRGLSPYPGAFTMIDSKGKACFLKIFEADYVEEPHNYKPGSFISKNNHKPSFATIDGFILPKIVQLEGKKRMTTDELLRGATID